MFIYDCTSHRYTIKCTWTSFLGCTHTDPATSMQNIMASGATLLSMYMVCKSSIDFYLIDLWNFRFYRHTAVRTGEILLSLRYDRIRFYNSNFSWACSTLAGLHVVRLRISEYQSCKVASCVSADGLTTRLFEKTEVLRLNTGKWNYRPSSWPPHLLIWHLSGLVLASRAFILIILRSSPLISKIAQLAPTFTLCDKLPTSKCILLRVIALSHIDAP